MIEYLNKYNQLNSGLHVEIHKDKVKIFNSRYSDIVQAEFYFHYVLINPLSMKVTVLNSDKEVLSVIYHTARILDMRD